MSANPDSLPIRDCPLTFHTDLTGSRVKTGTGAETAIHGFKPHRHITELRRNRSSNTGSEIEAAVKHHVTGGHTVSANILLAVHQHTQPRQAILSGSLRMGALS